MTESPTAQKKHLRQQAMQHRQSLDMPALSLAIRQNIREWSLFQKAQTIMTYAALPDEVGLLPLCEDYPDKTWYLPRITNSAILAFHRYHPGDELSKNDYGIPEPLSTADPFIPGKMTSDLIFVPALMIDSQGIRLGFGKGYYDRFLSSLEKIPMTATPICAGLMVASLPAEAWDIPIHWAISEQEVLKLQQ